jgi:hypothetical protein
MSMLSIHIPIIPLGQPRELVNELVGNDKFSGQRQLLAKTLIHGPPKGLAEEDNRWPMLCLIEQDTIGTKVGNT